MLPSVKEMRTTSHKEDVMKKVKMARVEIPYLTYREIKELLQDMRDMYELEDGNFNRLGFGREDWKKARMIGQLLRHVGFPLSEAEIVTVPKKAVELFESL